MIKEVLSVIGAGTGIVAIIATVITLGSINNQLDLMDAQIQDTKHENIITRINNARGILWVCDIDHKEKSRIDRILFDASRSATLLNDFDGAEKTLNQFVDDLNNCEPLTSGGTFFPEEERFPYTASLERFIPIIVIPVYDFPILNQTDLNNTKSKP